MPPAVSGQAESEQGMYDAIKLFVAKVSREKKVYPKAISLYTYIQQMRLG